MNAKRIVLLLCCIIFILLLLLFPNIAIDGSTRGLTLWFQILVPTLLPFFILSALLRCLVQKPSGTFLFLIIGLFSGYPVGAKIVGSEYLQGNLTKRQTYFFLNLCNQASPVFLLVFVGVQTLHLTTGRYLFFFIIHLSALVGSCLLTFLIRKKQDSTTTGTPSSCKKLPLAERFDQILLESMITIVKIGCYVILFSILASFVNNIFSSYPLAGILVSGFFEITTGMLQLEGASLPAIEKIVLASMLISFGGLSALAQTKSVLPETGLSIKIYFLYKITSAFSACILSLLFFFLFHGF